MKNQWTYFLLVVSMLCFMGGTGNTAAAAAQKGSQAPVLQEKNLQRTIDYVIFTGDFIQDFLGKEISGLRLCAFQDGQMQIIPFQVDEINEDGYRVLPEGPKGNPEEGNGLLDSQDEVMFMVKDSGDRVNPSRWFPGAGSVELEMLDPISDERAWIYLYSFSADPPPLSDRDYVHYDHEGGGKNTTDYYVLDHLKSEKGLPTVAANHYSNPPSAGGTGVNYLDRMKLRIEASLLRGMIDLTVSEQNIGLDIWSYVDGPVRSIERGAPQVQLPLGIKYTIKAVAEVNYYQYGTVVPQIIGLPFNPKYVLGSLHWRYNYEMNPDAIGMIWFNTQNRDGFMVDGVMSPEEIERDETPDKWRLWTGPQGTLLLRSMVEPRFDEALKVPPNRSYIYYLDDIEDPDPPEDHIGQIAQTGYTLMIKNLTADEYHVHTLWYWPPHFYNPEQPEKMNEEYLEMVLRHFDSPLQLSVNGASRPNQVYMPIPKF